MNNARTALQKLVYSLAGNKYKDLVTIALSWNSIVGKIMAERSSIVKYENSILFIKAVNHAWMQEFVIKKNEILKEFNNRSRVKIKDIIFFV